MATLAQQRCLHHETREAVCRCPVCRNFFCRECVVLFEARLLCATCLEAETAAAEPDNAKGGRTALLVALAAVGLLIVWLSFYLAGWAIVQSRPAAPLAYAADLWIRA